MTKPKINPPLRTIDIIIEAMAGICLAYLIVQLIIEYPLLTGTVPTHFDAAGNPDDWGGKATLLIMPVVTIIMYAGLTVLNRFPHLFNYPVSISEKNALNQYQYAKTLLVALKFTTTGLFLFVQHQTISVAKHIQTELGTKYLIIVVIGSFVPVIIYMVVAFRNK